MNKIVWVAIVMAGSAGVVQAQSMERIALASTTANGRQAAQAVARSVSLDVQDVTVLQALQEIVRRSGMTIGYSPADVGAIRKKISLRVQDVSIESAVRQIVAGSGLQVLVSSAGSINVLKTGAVENTSVRQGILIGKVVHAKTKQPVSGVQIVLDGVIQNVKTGDDGVFRIAVPLGEHTLQIRGVGFVRHARKVIVSDGENVSLEIALEPTASVLDEVVVTGTVVATARKEIPTPITVITADDIEKRGMTRIEELFRGEVPGVLATEQGTAALHDDSLGAGVVSQVFARGASNLTGVGWGAATPLKTYVDGVELLDPTYLGTIDVRSIERIEIITGPQAATIYGSGAMGGVMQIFTKTGSGRTAPELTFRLKYGILENSLSPGLTPAHDHAVAMNGGAGPIFSYSGNVSYGYTGQWQPKMFSRRFGVSAGVTHVQGGLTATASAAASATQNGTVGQFTGAVFRYLESVGEIWTGEPAAFNRQRISKTNSQTVSLNVDYRTSASWQHHVTVGRSQTNFDLDPIEPAFVTGADSLFRVSSSTGQRVTANYNTTILPRRLGVLSSTLTLGTNGSMGNQTRLDGCRAEEGASAFVSCTSNGTIQASRTLNERSWGGFGSLRLGAFDQLYVTLGLRAERNRTYGTGHKIDWTPTNGVAYTMEFGALTAKLFGSYGRATRAPSEDQRLERLAFSQLYMPNQYVSQLANPGLTPEYSRGPQGGLELYYGNHGSLAINHYQQTVTDLISRLLVDTIIRIRLTTGVTSSYDQYQYLNVAEIRSYGWETTGSVNLNAFTVRGSYSWNDSRVAKIDERNSTLRAYFPVGASLKGVITHSGSATASYARGGTNVSITGNYVGKYLMQTTARGLWDGYFDYRLSQARIKTYNESSQPGGCNCQRVTRAYVKGNLAMSHRVTPDISATLNIANLGDNYTSDTYGPRMFPSLGRQTKLGVAIKFPRSHGR